MFSTLDTTTTGQPRYVDAAALVHLDPVAADADVLEVRVTTVTVHRVTRRALQQIAADNANGVRGFSTLGELLAMHEGVAMRHSHRDGAVERISIDGVSDAATDAGFDVAGWDRDATVAADAAVTVAGGDGIARWLVAHADALNAKRQLAGFAPLPDSARVAMFRRRQADAVEVDLDAAEDRRAVAGAPTPPALRGRRASGSGIAAAAER